jgi:hypothetical protein
LQLAPPPVYAIVIPHTTTQISPIVTVVDGSDDVGSVVCETLDVVDYTKPRFTTQPTHTHTFTSKHNTVVGGTGVGAGVGQSEMSMTLIDAEHELARGTH